MMSVKRQSLEAPKTLLEVNESDISERESGESLEGSEEEEEQDEEQAPQKADVSNADVKPGKETTEHGFSNKRKRSKVDSNYKDGQKDTSGGVGENSENNGKIGRDQVKGDGKMESNDSVQSDKAHLSGTAVVAARKTSTENTLEATNGVSNSTGDGKSTGSDRTDKQLDQETNMESDDNEQGSAVMGGTTTMKDGNQLDGVRSERTSLTDDKPEDKETKNLEDIDKTTQMPSVNNDGKPSAHVDSNRRTSAPDDGASVGSGHSGNQLTRSHSPASSSDMPTIAVKEPTMTAPAPTSSRLQEHRSSLFELGIRRPTVTGSSQLSFAIDPSRYTDDEFFAPKPQNKIQYENTFRMEPEKKFLPEAVNAIIKEELETQLEGKSYEPISCGILTKTIAQDIKHKVQAMNFPRYRYVSLVTIGEKKDQGVRFGSRCVWDHQRDSYATSFYETHQLYAVGTLYAIYYE